MGQKERCSCVMASDGDLFKLRRHILWVDSLSVRFQQQDPYVTSSLSDIVCYGLSGV